MTPKTTRFFGIALSFMFLLLTLPAFSKQGDTEFVGLDEKYKLLRGLKSVSVVIGTSKKYPDQAEQFRTAARKQIEEKLTEKGIKVENAASPFLRLTVTPVTDYETDKLTGSFLLNMEFLEPVTLRRNPSQQYYGVTWTAGTSLTIDNINSPSGEKYIELQLTKFIADYHRANRSF